MQVDQSDLLSPTETKLRENRFEAAFLRQRVASQKPDHKSALSLRHELQKAVHAASTAASAPSRQALVRAPSSCRHLAQGMR